MEVNSHSEAATLGGDEAEDIVLERLIIAGAGPGFLGFGLRGVADFQGTKIRHLEFLGDGAALPMALESRADDLIQVLGESGGTGGDSALRIVALEETIFVG